jgi:hypothetical protein
LPLPKGGPRTEPFGGSRTGERRRGAPPINVSARNISARNALQAFVVVNGTVVVWNQNVLNGRNVGATVQVTSITVG